MRCSGGRRGIPLRRPFLRKADSQDAVSSRRDAAPRRAACAAFRAAVRGGSRGNTAPRRGMCAASGSDVNRRSRGKMRTGDFYL
ncbi:MAG TPA: hypothetical protein DEP61_03890 [Lachnospiraceae bacterium]|nr:hypothetical protein [Lachnospiraceae bacterium]